MRSPPRQAQGKANVFSGKMQFHVLCCTIKGRKGVMKLPPVALDGILHNEMVRLVAGDTTAIAGQYTCRLTGT